MVEVSSPIISEDFKNPLPVGSLTAKSALRAHLLSDPVLGAGHSRNKQTSSLL